MKACRKLFHRQVLKRFSKERSRGTGELEEQLKLVPEFTFEKYQEFMTKYERSISEDSEK